jgi:beta-lactamase class A
MTDIPRSQTARISRRSLLLASAGFAVPTAVRADPVDPIKPLVSGIDIPDTPVGRQLTWVLEQVNRSARGLSVREIKQHVDPWYLTGLPADQIRSVLKNYVGPHGPFAPARFEGGVTDTRAHAILVNVAGDTWRIQLGVTATEPFLINQLYFVPVGVPAAPVPLPKDWDDFIDAFQDLAPRVSFAAAELTEYGPRWLGRIHGNEQRAIASSFKLYVLGDLVRQIETNEVGWQELLAIEDHLRSLPTGALYLAAPGTLLPVETFAEQMISASDNTATDHLIARLGRSHVQDAFTELGHSHPTRNLPLLMTREWFAMRMRLRDTQIERYLAADAGNRLRILANTVDPLADQLSDAEAWPGPRFIDQVEWFAGAADLVRALDWLWRHSDDAIGTPVRDALSLNPGICWHPGTWRYVGYKGGYETGVMSNTWLLERQDGRWFGLAAIINDTRREINANGMWSLLTAAERLLAKTA